jgi:hypothetical protein
MANVTPGWGFISIGFEGASVDVHGFDPWQCEWSRCADETITVAHPSYPHQRHTMFVYRLAEAPHVRFAAGEFSNGVWGFFVPSREDDATDPRHRQE